MHELILTLAKFTPFNVFVEKLEDDLVKYKADPTDDNREKMIFACTMIAMSRAVDDKPIEETLREANNVSRIMEQLKSAQ